MTKKYIAIIYEGEKTERQLVDNLNKVSLKIFPNWFPSCFRQAKIYTCCGNN